MFNKISTRALRTGAFFATLGSAVALAAALGGQSINIDINCGQGIVDARHKIEYQIKTPDGTIKTATAYVAKSGSEEGATLSSETVLDRALDGDTQRDGTTLQLPPDHTIEKVTVYKWDGAGVDPWDENDGHLHVENDQGKTISNQ